MASTDLGNQWFKTCSWIPLTMVNSLLLNSALLEIRIPALACNCSYASSVMNKTRNPLKKKVTEKILKRPKTIRQPKQKLFTGEVREAKPIHENFLADL